jgi:hypothetical protein
MHTLKKDERKKNLSDFRDQVGKLELELEISQLLIDMSVPPEFVQLFGATFYIGDAKLLFMRSITKAEKMLGRFTNRSGDTMTFHSRANSLTYRRKSTVMTLVCGNDNKFVSLKEVSTDKFQAVFATPAVCTQDKIDALRTKGLEELRKIREYM